MKGKARIEIDIANLHRNLAVKNGIQSLTSFPVIHLGLEIPPCTITGKSHLFKQQLLFLDFRNSPAICQWHGLFIKSLFEMVSV